MNTPQEGPNENERIYSDAELGEMLGHPKLEKIDDLDLFDSEQVKLTEQIETGQFQFHVSLAMQLMLAAFTNLANRPLPWWRRLAYETAKSPEQTPARRVTARTLFEVVKLLEKVDAIRAEELGTLTYAQSTLSGNEPPELTVEG